MDWNCQSNKSALLKCLSPRFCLGDCLEKRRLLAVGGWRHEGGSWLLSRLGTLLGIGLRSLDLWPCNLVLLHPCFDFTILNDFVFLFDNFRRVYNVFCPYLSPPPPPLFPIPTSSPNNGHALCSHLLLSLLWTQWVWLRLLTCARVWRY